MLIVDPPRPPRFRRFRQNSGRRGHFDGIDGNAVTPSWGECPSGRPGPACGPPVRSGRAPFARSSLGGGSGSSVVPPRGRSDHGQDAGPDRLGKLGPGGHDFAQTGRIGVRHGSTSGSTRGTDRGGLRRSLAGCGDRSFGTVSTQLVGRDGFWRGLTGTVVSSGGGIRTPDTRIMIPLL